MVPKFTEFMYSALECLKDGKGQKTSDIYDRLKEYHKLTEDDMNEMVEGTQTL